MSLTFAPVNSPYDAPGALEADLDFLGVRYGIDGVAGQLRASAVVGYTDVDGAGHLVKARPSGGSYFIVTDPAGVEGGPWRAWIVGVPGAEPSQARVPVPTNSTPTPAPAASSSPAPSSSTTTVTTSCAAGCTPTMGGGCSCSSRPSMTLALGALALAFLLLSE